MSSINLSAPHFVAAPPLKAVKNPLLGHERKSINAWHATLARIENHYLAPMIRRSMTCGTPRSGGRIAKFLAPQNGAVEKNL
jgi:hypothetical protein